MTTTMGSAVNPWSLFKSEEDKINKLMVDLGDVFVSSGVSNKFGSCSKKR